MRYSNILIMAADQTLCTDLNRICNYSARCLRRCDAQSQWKHLQPNWHYPCGLNSRKKKTYITFNQTCHLAESSESCFRSTVKSYLMYNDQMCQSERKLDLCWSEPVNKSDSESHLTNEQFKVKPITRQWSYLQLGSASMFVQNKHIVFTIDW